MKKLTLEEMAKVCYAANSQFSQCITDGLQDGTKWEDLPIDYKTQIIDGVKFFLKYPHSRPSELHNNWLIKKQQQGWVYGEKLDPSKDVKTHPDMVSFEKLPQEQQQKNYLFRAVVRALYPLYDGEKIDSVYDTDHVSNSSEDS